MQSCSASAMTLLGRRRQRQLRRLGSPRMSTAQAAGSQARLPIAFACCKRRASTPKPWTSSAGQSRSATSKVAEALDTGPTTARSKAAWRPSLGLNLFPASTSRGRSLVALLRRPQRVLGARRHWRAFAAALMWQDSAQADIDYRPSIALRWLFGRQRSRQ